MKTHLTLAICLVSLFSFAQIENIEDQFTKTYLSPEEVYFNAQYLIPEYHQKNELDSTYAVLDFWEEQCGESGESMRCKILLSIESNSFSEDIYGDNIMDYLADYKSSFQSNKAPRINYWQWNYAQRYNHKSKLNTWATALAKDLLQRANISELERFFLRLYSNDFDHTFRMLNSDSLKSTKIGEYYEKVRKDSQLNYKGRGEIVFGAWVPNGNLSTLGPKPYFGFKIGSKRNKWMTDLVFGMKFGQSENTYQVELNDSLYNTTHFFGGNVGFEAGYQLFSKGKSEIDLIGGFGYGGFTGLMLNDNNTDTNDPSKNFGSWNANLGLGYKFFRTPVNYWGIEAKYQTVNYRNTIGTDLSGDVVLLNLIFGFNGDAYVNNRMRTLDF